jgi:hypothetical protein
MRPPRYALRRRSSARLCGIERVPEPKRGWSIFTCYRQCDCLVVRSMKRVSGAVIVVGALAIGAAWSQPVSRDAVTAERIVEQLRDLPTPLPIVGNGPSPVGERPPIPPSEVLRDELYRRLHSLGPSAVTALARGYQDVDVRLRRNVALSFLVLGEGIWERLPKMDISAALPELTIALEDTDPDVRAWSAQAIGSIGARAASALPALIRLLSNEDEGSRNSACIALRGIGPDASGAIPALRRALSDRSDDVRKSARRAIDAIEG